MKKYKVIISLLLIVMATSCKKYEEGPLISLRTPMGRLQGRWHVVNYTNNGVDSTYFKLNNFDFFYCLSFYYKKNNAVSGLLGGFKELYNCLDWENNFKENNYKYIQFKVSLNLASGHKKGLISFPPFDSTSEYIVSKWKILRLTNQELKIRFIDSNDKETNIIIDLAVETTLKLFTLKTFHNCKYLSGIYTSRAEAIIVNVITE